MVLPFSRSLILKVLESPGPGRKVWLTWLHWSGKAYLAQSPQLAKQMAIAADFERVFEVGPVFRAELSFTSRHLTEFTGLDLEMTIEESYEEVVDILDGMLMYIFKGIQSKFANELEIIGRQFPSEPFVWLEETLKLKWRDAISLLRENGVQIGDFEDLSCGFFSLNHPGITS